MLWKRTSQFDDSLRGIMILDSGDSSLHAENAKPKTMNQSRRRAPLLAHPDPRGSKHLLDRTPQHAAGKHLGTMQRSCGVLCQAVGKGAAGVDPNLPASRGRRGSRGHTDTIPKRRRGRQDAPHAIRFRSGGVGMGEMFISIFRTGVHP